MGTFAVSFFASNLIGAGATVGAGEVIDGLGAVAAGGEGALGGVMPEGAAAGARGGEMLGPDEGGLGMDGTDGGLGMAGIDGAEGGATGALTGLGGRLMGEPP